MPTPNRGYVYPATSSPATVPADLRAPLEQVDADVQTLVDELGEMVSLNPDGTLPEAAEQQVEAIARENGTPPGSIPIFSTLAEAQAWELANPGRKALTIEPQTPDVAPPAPGALTVSVTDVTANLAVTGASDDRAVAGYAFKVGVAPWSDWQPSAHYLASGLTADTEYTFSHKVKDAAGNEAQGMPVTRTTAALGPKAPSEIGSLVAHWDASKPGALSTSGSSVVGWGDQSAHGRDFAQADAAKRPIVATMGGLTAVQFDRAQQQFMRYLDGAFTVDTTAGYTLCIVGRIDDTATTSDQVMAGIANGANPGRRGADGIVMDLVGGLAGPASQKPTAGQVVIIAAVMKSGGPSYIWVSGASGTVGTTTLQNHGVAVDVGRSTGNVNYSSVTLGEVWIHSKPLAAGELAALRVYAQGKWGAL